MSQIFCSEKARRAYRPVVEGLLGRAPTEQELDGFILRFRVQLLAYSIVVLGLLGFGFYFLRKPWFILVPLVSLAAVWIIREIGKRW